MADVSRRSVLGGSAAVASLALVGAKANAALPVEAPQTFSTVPELDVKQSGQLRHVHNIAQQELSDFSHMLGPDPDNIGDFVGYRWQIMGMADAMTLAYQNYLPNAPGAYKDDYLRLISKLQRQEVWNYWREMSRFSKGTPPNGLAKGEGWWDPVVKENIFYSGLLGHTVAQYAYFFSDDRYDKVGSIAFEKPKYSNGADRVEYSLQTLLDTIYWQMVENGYLGVACQPDMVFNSCSQMPIHAFNYEDRRNGTDRARQVISAHEAAWRKLGGYIDGKPMPTVHMMSADRTIDVPWGLGYFVFNQWNPGYFRSTYPMVRASVLRKTASRVDLYPMDQYGDTQAAFFAGAPQPEPRRDSKGGDAIAGPYGTVASLLAEAGDPDRDALLAQADKYMNPTWENGGLYYPRRDADWDEDGNVIGVAPTTTFSLAVARLNSGDGLRNLFVQDVPPSRASEPLVAQSSGTVDITRARFIADHNQLLVTVKPPHGSDGANGAFSIANMKRRGQSWVMTADGRRIASGNAAGDLEARDGTAGWRGDELALTLPIRKRTDILVQWS